MEGKDKSPLLCPADQCECFSMTIDHCSLAAYQTIPQFNSVSEVQSIRAKHIGRLRSLIRLARVMAIEEATMESDIRKVGGRQRQACSCVIHPASLLALADSPAQHIA
eukprot:scaffold58800_cov32-Prasinocladus_malaysianus.AAC.1